MSVRFTHKSEIIVDATPVPSTPSLHLCAAPGPAGTEPWPIQTMTCPSSNDLDLSRWWALCLRRYASPRGMVRRTAGQLPVQPVGLASFDREGTAHLVPQWPQPFVHGASFLQDGSKASDVRSSQGRRDRPQQGVWYGQDRPVRKWCGVPER